MSDGVDPEDVKALRLRAESILERGVDPAIHPVPEGADLTHELHVAHQELVLQTRALTDTEGRLRQALARSQTLFGQAPCALLWIDARLHVARANRRSIELLGAVEGASLLGAVHPAERATAKRFLEHVTAEYESSMTVRLLRGSTVLSCHLRAVRVEDPGDRSTLAFIEPMDSYVELAHRGNLFEAAINQSAQGVLITTADLDGDGPRAVYVNDAMCRMSGQTRGELLGRPPWPTPADAQAGERARIHEAMRARSAARVRLSHDRPDGSTCITDVWINPIFDTDGQVRNFVSVHTDVTHEVREARRREHAQRLEAVGTLAGGLAHDFNNLLTVIHTLAEMGREDARQDDIVALFGDILGAAQRASVLTRRLLAFSRNDASPAKLVDVRRTLEDIAGMARRLVPATIDLDVRHGEGDPRLLIDPIHLEQIVLNLVTNARDAFGGEAGSIRLGWQRSAGAEAEPALEPGAYIRIDAVDDGPGIPPELRATAFDPFVTTKPAHQGTGLGLAMVSDIARRHGGGTGLGPAEGPTRVSVFLPEHRGRTVSGAPRPPAGGRARSSALSIVVVEDDPAVRDATHRALAASGHRVRSFAEPTHALPFLEAHETDVLVTDVVMPSISGVDLVERARARGLEFGVVFVSGFVGAEMRGRPLQARERFLPKPFATADLLDAVTGVAR